MEQIRKIKELLGPYYDVMLFVVCLFAANWFWKWTISGDEAIGDVYWFDFDITAPFARLSEHIAGVCAWMLELVRGDAVIYRPPYSIHFSSGFGIRIVWSCTPVKQCFIWLVIMLFACGSMKKKLWFVPLGWVLIHVFNILRIVVIALLCENHHDMFVFWHEHFFKYVFYGMMFLLWVCWVEWISPSSSVRTGAESGS